MCILYVILTNGVYSSLEKIKGICGISCMYSLMAFSNTNVVSFFGKKSMTSTHFILNNIQDHLDCLQKKLAYKFMSLLNQNSRV